MPPTISTNNSTNESYSSDLLGRMNPPPALSRSSASFSRPGVPYPAQHRSSLQTPKNRNSLPINALTYHFDLSDGDFSQKQLGDRTSMVATYNSPSKQRTHHYEEQFQYKENATNSARDRVQRESPVVAELRTNVIIKDEFTLVTDLSYHLAARYTRLDSAIMVKVDHSACLALGGTFDPCYILTITTVSSQMGPTMNKRNAALIQAFMADILSVPPERGIVKFAPISEENYAINGTTMLGEIERQEKQQPNDGGSAVRRAISNGRKSLPSFKRSPANFDAESKIVEEETTTDTNTRNSRTTESRPKIERKGSAPSTVMLSSNAVFELPAVEMEPKRPSTAHSHTASSGSNGLRMNGISDAELQQLQRSKPKDGRPRTFSGSTASVQEQIKKQGLVEARTTPLPARHSSTSHAKRERPHSFLKTDPSQAMPKSPTTATSVKTGNLSPPLDSKTRPRDSYIDGLMGAPAQLKSLAELSKESQISDDSLDKLEPTANTAKRRSTVTASTTKKLPIPPVPDTPTDTKSTKSLKVGKRKSFLSAFRRSATPAQ